MEAAESLFQTAAIWSQERERNFINRRIKAFALQDQKKQPENC